MDPQADEGGSGSGSGRVLPERTLSAPLGKTALVLLVCAAFVAGGVMVLRSDDRTVFDIVGSILAIVFFGGGGLFLLIKMTRSRTVLTLTSEGVRPVSGGFVPWGDVGEVGVTTTANTAVIGIRLSSHDAYIASLSDAEVRTALRVSSAARVLGAASRSLYRGRNGRALADIPDASQGMRAQLAWARDQSGGYDLTFSPLLFRGSAASVVAAITEYRDAWRSRGGRTRST